MSNLSIGQKMFSTYEAKYADWVARGCPPAPSLPTHWVWRKKAQPVGMLRQLAEAQDGDCSLCGKPLDFTASPNNPHQPTFEHVVPRIMGGGNHGNRLAAHRRCNTRKGGNKPTGCELVLLESVNARLYGSTNP